MLRDDKEDVNLLNSLMASNFSDGKIDPWVDKLPFPAPVGEYITISRGPHGSWHVSLLQQLIMQIPIEHLCECNLLVLQDTSVNKIIQSSYPQRIITLIGEVIH